MGQHQFRFTVFVPQNINSAVTIQYDCGGGYRNISIGDYGLRDRNNAATGSQLFFGEDYLLGEVQQVDVSALISR
jgi:hypothetical protein